MKYLQKLNPKGFAHEMALVIIVLVAAVGGTFYLVASHADSCTTPSSSPVSSTAVSSPTSSPNCTPTSSPASSPVSSALTHLGNCSISGVPTTVASGTVFTPSVVVTNVGTGSIKPILSYRYGNPTVGYSTRQTVSLTNIAPGQQQTAALAPYSAQSKTDVSINLTLTSGSNTAHFSCTQWFSVTAPPSSI